MITFYFDIKGIGGVQNLIITLTKQLTEMGIPVKIFHYSNDFIFNELKPIINKIYFYDINSIKGGELKNYLSNDDLIIITKLSRNLFHLGRLNPKILFWNVFPSSASELNELFNFNVKLLNKTLIYHLIKSNGIVFMDETGPNDLQNKGYIISSPINFLQVPVVIDTIKNQFLLHKKSKSGCNITYIGRAVDWKIYPFIKVLKDFNRIIRIRNEDFTFHIITDDIEVFKSYLLDQEKTLHIKYYENLSTLKLNQLLVGFSDLHFGMGTSALEASKHGIPTVTIDASNSQLPDDYKYRWIFETSNFCLGKIIKKDGHLEGKNSLDDILKIAYNEEFKKEISDKCFWYTIHNHDIKQVTLKLLNYQDNCISFISEFNKRNIRFYSSKLKRFFIKL